MAIHPLIKFFASKPEANLRTRIKYNLKPGISYVIKEREFKRGPKIFKDLVTHGIPGLWITMSLPEKIRKEHGLEKTPILYLSTKPGFGEARVSLDRLEKVQGIISNYFFRKRPKRSVVLVDCLDELVMRKGPKQVIYFLAGLWKACWENRSNLLISSKVFTKRKIMAIVGETILEL